MLWTVLLLAAAAGIPSYAAGPAEDRAALIGRPTTLVIAPEQPVLQGRRATAQLTATGTYGEPAIRDLTRAVEWVSLQPEIATVNARGQVRPVSNGVATIVARAGGIESARKVTVQAADQPAPVSFRHDVVPALSQASCNMGACHGTPTGKGGFRLSLRGYLPEQDFDILTREAGGRRITPIAAADSLVLRKPLGESPHEGGLRLRRDSKSYEFIHDWIAAGAKNDPGASKAVKLEIAPGDRVLYAPAKSQQVAVTVHYADGRTRDVTPLCYFDTSRPDVAEVDADGHVTFKSRGEAAIIAHYLDLVAITHLTHLVEVPGFSPAPVPTDNLIDQAVFAKLNRMRIAPSPAASDREFLRRLYLDVIGVLPKPAEVEQYLKDNPADRDQKLVDRLLERPEYYDFWTLRLADVFRANSRLIQAKGSYVFTRWIKSQLQRNAPMNEMVRELIVAQGSTYTNPAANYYRISRDPESSVETTAQLFLGVRIQCAKCHNHPFERWTQDDYYGFAAFFARVRQKKGALGDDEVIFVSQGGDVRQPRTGAVMKPKALGGSTYEDQPNGDRREALARWLASQDNPFFAKSLTNRIWYHLMGRGVVEPVDDFRDSNPPTNDELLNNLSADFATHNFDLKRLIKTVVLSRTYRLSAETVPLNQDDNLYFSHAVTKLLPAEVLLDAISNVTNSAGAFAGLPVGTHAIQIPDGSMEDPFLKTFGRPARELACECERESDSNLSQALQLIGGATVNNKLRDDKGRLAELAKSALAPEAIVKELYLVALSREPGAEELKAAVAHLQATKDRRQAVEDLGWVLINSKEFLFRH